MQTLLYSETTNLFRNISSAYSLLLKTRFPALLLSVLIQSQMLSNAMDSWATIIYRKALSVDFFALTECKMRKPPHCPTVSAMTQRWKNLGKFERKHSYQMRISLWTHKLIKFNLANSVSIGMNINILLNIGVCWAGVSGEFNTHLFGRSDRSSSKHKFADTTRFAYSNYERDETNCQKIKQRWIRTWIIANRERKNNNNWSSTTFSWTDDETSRRNFQKEV